MTTSTLLLIRPEVQSESDGTARVWLDWSDAASPAVLPGPRLQLPAYVFHGSTDSHLDGQRCDLVDPDDTGPGVQAVRFSCGCVGQVPMSSLERQ